MNTETVFAGAKIVESVNYKAQINEMKDGYELSFVTPLGSRKIALVGLGGLNIKSTDGSSVFITTERLGEFMQIVSECQLELRKHKLV